MRNQEGHKMTRVEDLRNITPRDLAALGLNDVAYVKAIKGEQGRMYSIHAADGTQMAVTEDRDVALAAIRQHDLEPMSAH